MEAFSLLLDRLYYTHSTLAKMALLQDYFASTPDPDRGYTVAALAGELSFDLFKRRTISELIKERVDPVLFDLSRDYVGEAYSGFTDQELRKLDKWVRDHTIARYGPVREVEKALVFEVAFDSAHASPRHKSGFALRFPRIHRIRWDKPAGEADIMDTLAALVP